MRKGIGISCIILGFLCILTAVGFVAYNRMEADNGEKDAHSLLQELQAGMDGAGDMQTDVPVEIGQESLVPQMLTVPVGDYESIGILSIPVLELELPVLMDWSYEKLRKAPCHYYGSYYEPDFVIAAHNYAPHFGRLSKLQAGDLVMFTDVTGAVYCYEVVLLETLAPTATKEMITSGFDLSLYTCTPGGANRVTVRCRTVHP